MGYWLKLYTDILEDPKYYKLSEESKLGFYEILLVAKKLDDGDLNGILPCIEDIAFYTRRDTKFWENVLSELVEIGLVTSENETITIKNYHKRQAAIPVDERVKQYRKRRNDAVMKDETLATQYCNDDVTFRNGETETETETDIDSEIDKNTNFSQKSIPKGKTVLDDVDIFSPLPKQTPTLRKYLTKISEIFENEIRNKTQVLYLYELREKFGEENVFSACVWAATKGWTLGDSVTRIAAALPNWNNKPPPKKEESKKPKTLGELIEIQEREEKENEQS